MKSENITDFQKLANSHSLKDISLVLSNIDDKIVSLHKCSSDDFLTFNSYLKKYHKEAKVIAENSGQIYNMVIGKDNNPFFDGLNNFHDQLKNHVEGYVNQIDSSMLLLDKILAQFDLMFIPFKNFKQNFTTLKFIITNLKHKLYYLDVETQKELDISIRNINNVIFNAISVYRIIENHLQPLKLSISNSLGDLQEMKKLNLVNLQTILNKIYSSIHLISDVHAQVSSKIPLLTQRSANYFDNIHKIITNIQYHDIIRQRMEHIQKAHHDIIEQLKELEQSDNEEFNKSELEICFVKISDIAGLQIAQLLHINKQYQNAIKNITTQFFEISEDMNSISHLSSQLETYSKNNNICRLRHFTIIKMIKEDDAERNHLRELYLFLGKKEISFCGAMRGEEEMK